MCQLAEAKYICGQSESLHKAVPWGDHSPLVAAERIGVSSGMASVCMRCGKPVLKDGQMCTKTDGQPWPCREEGEAAGSIEVDGLIVRVGDNYGTPIMDVKDPYAKEQPKKRPPTATCG